jgi:putative hydrolase of the HAD superfamily
MQVAAPLDEPCSLRAILYDLFGTLVPTGGRDARIRNLEEMANVLKVRTDTFAERWLGSSDSRDQGAMGSLEETIRILATESGGRPTRTEVRRAVELKLDFTRRLLASCELTLPSLGALRNAGFRLAVVSNTAEDTVRLWSVTPLASRFEVAVFSCVEGLRKPDPRIYRISLSKLGLDPADCAFVGDGGDHELSGAKSVGLHTFLYRYPCEGEGFAFRPGADDRWSGPRVNNLLELLRFCPLVTREWR